MEKESWKINYYMKTNTGEIVELQETLKFDKGYHEKFLEYCGDNPHFKLEDKQPVYKVRGNYVELLSLGFFTGTHLPLEKIVELRGSEILVSKDHPIGLTAPDGTEYSLDKI